MKFYALVLFFCALPSNAMQPQDNTLPDTVRRKKRSYRSHDYFDYVQIVRRPKNTETVRQLKK